MRTFVTPEGEVAPNAFGKLASGAISGAVAQTLTYPADVLRRKFQVTSMSGIGYKYTTVRGAVRDILATEGYRGFTRGLWPNILKVAPSMASSFAVCSLFLLNFPFY